MSNIYEFRNIHQNTETYSDGTQVPHLKVDVYLNGKQVGYAEIHLHKATTDSKPDVSFGFTGRVYAGTV